MLKVITNHSLLSTGGGLNRIRCFEILNLVVIGGGGQGGSLAVYLVFHMFDRFFQMNW